MHLYLVNSEFWHFACNLHSTCPGNWLCALNECWLGGGEIASVLFDQNEWLSFSLKLVSFPSGAAILLFNWSGSGKSIFYVSSTKWRYITEENVSIDHCSYIQAFSMTAVLNPYLQSREMGKVLNGPVFFFVQGPYLELITFGDINFIRCSLAEALVRTPVTQFRCHTGHHTMQKISPRVINQAYGPGLLTCSCHQPVMCKGTLNILFS